MNVLINLVEFQLKQVISIRSLRMRIISAIMNFYLFVNNDVINHIHLWKDGLHLNENGKVVLTNNFLNYINNFLYQNRIVTHHIGNI